MMHFFLGKKIIQTHKMKNNNNDKDYTKIHVTQ